MEKVKLTREQAEEIEIRNKGFAKEETIKNHIFGWSYIECLNELTLDEMIRALYIGYEIEETFKVGDWVFDRESVYKIISKHHADDLNKGMYLKARHATPEEIEEEKQCRWWAKHGRKVWELRQSDVLVNKSNGKDWIVISEINKVSDCKNYRVFPFLTGEFEIMHLETIKRHFQIVCFAEDRKDVQA